MEYFKLSLILSLIFNILNITLKFKILFHILYSSNINKIYIKLGYK